MHSKNLIQLLPFQIGFGHFLQRSGCSAAVELLVDLGHSPAEETEQGLDSDQVLLQTGTHSWERGLAGTATIKTLTLSCLNQ